MSEESKDDKLIENLTHELQNAAEKESSANHEDNNNDDNNNKPKKKRSKLRILLYVIASMFGLGVLGFIGLVIMIYVISLELPSTDEFSKFKYNERNRILQT